MDLTDYFKIKYILQKYGKDDFTPDEVNKLRVYLDQLILEHSKGDPKTCGIA